MTANLDFIQTMAATAGASPETSPYWYNVNLVLHQFNGLVQGYNDHCEPSKKLSTFDLYMLNSAGDLETLIEVIDDDEALKKKKKKKPLTDIISILLETKDASGEKALLSDAAGDGEDDLLLLSYDEINKLSYLNMVIKETLRMYPPVPGGMALAASPQRISTLET
eukprot:GEZU01002685.1.p2 GENE.GEZU01002685.1~~GEZU01002685.1.p2  ORF type:complete len:166 (+),score=78.07 GEZU01002685.1:962-1459(+)